MNYNKIRTFKSVKNYILTKSSFWDNSVGCGRILKRIPQLNSKKNLVSVVIRLDARNALLRETNCHFQNAENKKKKGVLTTAEMFTGVKTFTINKKFSLVLHINKDKKVIG